MPEVPPSRLEPSQLQILSGSERFSFGATVLDFWRWSLGDLRMNTARGFLVEFLVAQAVGADAPMRVEWASHDVEAPDGTRIEVKASGYLQSWVTRRPSVPTFRFKSAYATTVWDSAVADYVEVDVEERVHIWVFALQTCREHESYDPLEIKQWEFRVLPHRSLVRTGQKSAGLSFFDRLGAPPVVWEELPSAITAGRREHDRLGTTST